MSYVGSEWIAIGPDGERLTIADLPDADTERWVPRRKARVVAAVQAGLISRETALKRYRLSDEEFETWRAIWSQFGLRGLRVTKINAVRGATKAVQAEDHASRNMVGATAPDSKGVVPDTYVKRLLEGLAGASIWRG